MENIERPKRKYLRAFVFKPKRLRFIKLLSLANSATMQHMDEPRFAKQERILAQWILTLAQTSVVQVVWLEGSLVDGRGDPGSDIDIRVGITDDAFVRLWEEDRTGLLTGLGEHLLLHNEEYVRALTQDGVLVELDAYRVSALNDLALHE